MKSRILYGLSLAAVITMFGVMLPSCDDSDAEEPTCAEGECAIPGSPCLVEQRACSSDNKGYMMCSVTGNATIGTWSDVMSCGAVMTCQNGECVVPSEKCTSTVPECTADNKGYRVCVSGAWSEPIMCTGATTCKAGQCTGENVTSTLPCKTVGEQRCVSSARIQICGADLFWQFMDCPPDVPVCDSDTNECAPASCTNNEVECVDDDTLATCVGNDWSYSKCPVDRPRCSVNQCVELTKECVPGNKKCVSEKQVSICNQSGFWEIGNFCTGTSTCYNGECAEKCSPGEKKCVTDAMAFVCGVGGVWESVTCSDGKVCSDGECRACKDGETRCHDAKSVETCVNGTWKKTTCEYEVCSSETGACLKPGDRCSEVYSYCNDNTLVWCSGSKLHTMKCRVCLMSRDGDGATCDVNNLSSTAKGRKCDRYGNTKQGDFAVDASYNEQQADCLMCKYIDDDYDPLAWVPVSQTYCR